MAAKKDSGGGGGSGWQLYPKAVAAAVAAGMVTGNYVPAALVVTVPLGYLLLRAVSGDSSPPSEK
jgi:hypothetical protein